MTIFVTAPASGVNGSLPAELLTRVADIVTDDRPYFYWDDLPERRRTIAL